VALFANAQKIMFLTQNIHFICKLLSEMKDLPPTLSKQKLYSWVTIRTAQVSTPGKQVLSFAVISSRVNFLSKGNILPMRAWNLVAHS